MEAKTYHAPGKIILSGEYAVLFGHKGIAVPAPLTVAITFSPNDGNDITCDWEADDEWTQYVQDIINHCVAIGSVPPGTLSITNEIPLNKGMGSSTAFVIAIAKCLLGEGCKPEALAIEDAVNPGHSGLDFAVIWNNAPVCFEDGATRLIDLPDNLLNGALLIDTGTPDQQTPELVTDIKNREQELKEHLAAIGNCSKRLMNGESLGTVMRDHAKAQEQLGFVTMEAKELIKKIEQEGGSAKIIGAGSRTGGCGMMLAINTSAALVADYPTISL